MTRRNRRRGENRDRRSREVPEELEAEDFYTEQGYLCSIDSGPDVEIWAPDMPYLKRLEERLRKYKIDCLAEGKQLILVSTSLEDHIGNFKGLSQEEIDYRSRLVAEVGSKVGMVTTTIYNHRLSWEELQEAISKKDYDAVPKKDRR